MKAAAPKIGEGCAKLDGPLAKAKGLDRKNGQLDRMRIIAEALAKETKEFTAKLAGIGAVNAFNGETNKVKNQLTGGYDEVPKVQREYKAAGVASVVVGDQNYGEGSSREHAAMEPRHLGVRAVIVKSFARIHETNLKKQGMLALTFDNENDYDLIQEDDTINFIDLVEFAPGQPLNVELVHADGTKDKIKLNHTYNEQQIGWFRAGSALDLIRQQNN